LAEAAFKSLVQMRDYEYLLCALAFYIVSWVKDLPIWDGHPPQIDFVPVVPEIIEQLKYKTRAGVTTRFKVKKASTFIKKGEAARFKEQWKVLLQQILVHRRDHFFPQMTYDVAWALRGVLLKALNEVGNFVEICSDEDNEMDLPSWANFFHYKAVFTTSNASSNPYRVYFGRRITSDRNGTKLNRADRELEDEHGTAVPGYSTVVSCNATGTDFLKATVKD
jgi:hypothetical protein